MTGSWSQAPETIVAVVEKRGRFWAAEPHFPSPGSGRNGRRSGGRGRIVLASNRIEESSSRGGMASAGELVLVRLGGGGRRRGGGDGRARIVRRIGRPDVARDAIEAMLLDRGLARGFTSEVLAAADRACAQGAARAVREVHEGRRRDLRGLTTLTIDPVSAQDFDDAISAQPLEEGVEGVAGRGGDGGGVRVWVHIADVSLYVQEGSSLDEEARRRGTSVYVPGAVEPMLAPALSNDACSLVPGAQRAALTVELDIIAVGDGARVVRSSFYRSLIRSDARLDYEQVDRMFAGLERAVDPWAAPLAAARAASAWLGGSRERAGGLVVQSGEPEVLFDEEGHVREIRTRTQTESHQLIEYLMIAANEAVARRLADAGVPCLYRVHERPEPTRVLRLIEQLTSLGVSTPALPKTMSSTQAADTLAEVSRRVERHVQTALRRGRDRGGSASGGRGAGEEEREVENGPWGGRLALSALVLRTLQQAYYSPHNIGHAGLHSACYCHFTSPIRRYPDLVCHRALLSTLGGEETPARTSDLGGLGEWASEREREAMRIERDGDDLARCFALEQELYEHGWERAFAGEVTGLISAGAFVAFGSGAEPTYEGMLPVRRMRREGERDWWALNEQETILCGERTGGAIRLGDPIEVRVAHVDTVRGRVDLLRRAR